jgi:hypothetical protein
MFVVINLSKPVWCSPFELDLLDAWCLRLNAVTGRRDARWW